MTKASTVYCVHKRLSNDCDHYDIMSPTSTKLARHSSTTSTNGFDSYSGGSIFSEGHVFEIESMQPYILENQFCELKPSIDYSCSDGGSRNDMDHFTDESFNETELSTDCYSLSPSLSSFTNNNSNHDNSPIKTPNKNNQSPIIQNSRNPADIVRVKHIQGLPLTGNDIQVLLKDRQKKDNHNMIERRRRFNINDRIRELCSLLPRTRSSLFSETANGRRLNKGVILKESVDYIKLLRCESGKMRVLQERFDTLNSLNKELMRRLQKFENRNTVDISRNSTNQLTPDIKYSMHLVDSRYNNGNVHTDKRNSTNDHIDHVGMINMNHHLEQENQDSIVLHTFEQENPESRLQHFTQEETRSSRIQNNSSNSSRSVGLRRSTRIACNNVMYDDSKRRRLNSNDEDAVNPVTDDDRYSDHIGEHMTCTQRFSDMINPMDEFTKMETSTSILNKNLGNDFCLSGINFSLKRSISSCHPMI